MKNYPPYYDFTIESKLNANNSSFNNDQHESYAKVLFDSITTKITLQELKNKLEWLFESVIYLSYNNADPYLVLQVRNNLCQDWKNDFQTLCQSKEFDLSTEIYPILLMTSDMVIVLLEKLFDTAPFVKLQNLVCNADILINTICEGFDSMQSPKEYSCGLIRIASSEGGRTLFKKWISITNFRTACEQSEIFKNAIKYLISTQGAHVDFMRYLVAEFKLEDNWLYTFY